MARKFKQTKVENELVVDLQKNSTFSHHESTPESTLSKKTKIIGGIIGIIGIIVAIGSIASWRYIKAFESTSPEQFSTVVSHIRQGWDLNIYQDQPSVELLILGIDDIKNQRDGSLLTDTMMIASIHKSGTINLISIPRDLWIESLKTKINSLYYYGEESEETTGRVLTSSVLEEITGIDIEYSLILSLDDVKSIIDDLGGIMVDVPRAFTDERFPRDDVDISTNDESILYETITFTAGPQSMNGDIALKFIRSRNSKDPVEGTDQARAIRQQIVFKSLFAKLTDKAIVANPALLGQLYARWDSLNIDLDITEAIAMIKPLANSTITIKTASIPIEKDDPPTAGILYNPPISKHKQWVYEPLDSSWEELQAWFSQQITIE